MSTTDAYVGDNFACRMAFFDRRCRQRAFRTYALLVEPCVQSTKEFGRIQSKHKTIQWPRVPPNGMACTVTTNDQFRLACLLQLSAWKLSAPAAVAAKLASAAVIAAAAGRLFAAVTFPPASRQKTSMVLPAVACTTTASTKSHTPWLWRTS